MPVAPSRVDDDAAAALRLGSLLGGGAIVCAPWGRACLAVLLWRRGGEGDAAVGWEWMDGWGQGRSVGWSVGPTLLRGFGRLRLRGDDDEWRGS